MGYEKQFELYGENYRILVMETKSELLSMMRDHAVTIMLMLALNILFPGGWPMYSINPLFPG